MLALSATGQNTVLLSKLTLPEWVRQSYQNNVKAIKWKQLPHVNNMGEDGWD